MNLVLSLMLVAFCVCYNVPETSGWGYRTNEENHSQLDDYETKPIPNAGQTDSFQVDSSRKQTVDSVDQQLTDDDEKNHRQYGRQYKLSNVSVEYIPGKDNGTWNVEKQEKTIELSKEVLETQHATCQVTTEELVATAQATVTRVLKGLCNAKEMENRFYNMEILLSNQLQMIKEIIGNIEDKLVYQEDKIIRGQKQLSNILNKNCGTNNGFQSFQTSPDPDRGDRGTEGRKVVEAKPQKLAEPDDDIFEEDLGGPREPEILKYNSSIHMETSLNGPPKKVFTYYWKIRHMHYKLTGWSSSRSLRSQSFYVFPSGYRMYLRVFPRQNEENFYIHVGVTKGDFDDSLKWPFPLKHKVHILDQTKEERTFEDIASRIWDPNKLCSEFNWQKPIKGDNYECVGLGFPHDVLKQREYIRKDTAVIKLTVYLEP